jgi:hypothetical protein
MPEDTIPVRAAVEAYLSATGSSPSLAEQIVAELHEPGTLPLDLLGDPLPYFIKDGHAVVERWRFDAMMARVRKRSEAETM